MEEEISKIIGNGSGKLFSIFKTRPTNQEPVFLKIFKRAKNFQNCILQIRLYCYKIWKNLPL